MTQFSQKVRDEQVNLKDYANTKKRNEFTEINEFKDGVIFEDYTQMKDGYFNLTVAQIDAIESLKLIVNKEWVLSKIPSANSKVYRAIINQAGTDDPVATVLENGLGGEVVWTRESDGRYIGTLAAAFTNNKTWCSVTGTGNADTTSTMSRGSSNVVRLDTLFAGSGSDAALSGASVEIRVYN